MRILLVEDDKNLGASLKQALERNLYAVDWLQDGEIAYDAIQEDIYKLVILDCNLPRMSGIEILQKTRQRKNKIPILLLTARDTPAQKVEGLDSGADDYIVKPFDLNEMLARMRALLRRSEGRTETTLSCGNVRLDPSANTVEKDGIPLIFTAKEFRLLVLLMERAGKYVTKHNIAYALYDEDNQAESNTIEVTIYNLRKKLGSDFIHSIRGVGYMVMK